MRIDRPTFHESWYRVAPLRPRLRVGVTVHRQVFRRRVWHVLADPVADEYHRLSSAGYALVALLNGSRTVQEAWELANRQLGDDAPTQGEAIRLLGQLWSCGLLHADVPADTGSMLRRMSQRRAREIRSRSEAFLFPRFHLFDPDSLLERTAPALSILFTRAFFVVWLILIGWALVRLAPESDRFLASAQNVISQSNALWLYLAFALTKAVHELAHGTACKVFAKRTGLPGAVHTLGIMLLIFVPAPYVDASSAWTLKGRRQRVIVGAAGMMAELLIASVAVHVWLAAPEGSLTSAMAHNVILIAGVSTLLFNGNPLLRYDAYYILCDLIDMPNLSQRSRAWLSHWVRSRVFGVRLPQFAIESPIDPPILATYGVASWAYRVLLTFAIAAVLSTQAFIIGVALAAGAVITWIVLPIVRSLRYLAFDPQLVGHRRRAVLATTVCGIAVLGPLALIPVPQAIRLHGVIEATQRTTIRAEAPGFIVSVLDAGHEVVVDQADLVQIENDSLVAEAARLTAQLSAAEARRRRALQSDPSIAAAARAEVAAIETRLLDVRTQISRLEMTPPHGGTWLPSSDCLPGRFISIGDELGQVSSMNHLTIRASGLQRDASLILSEPIVSASFRSRANPSKSRDATIHAVVRSGQEILPSPSLGIGAGGEIAEYQTGSDSGQSAEPFIEVRATPANFEDLRIGERILLRIELPPRPMAQHILRRIRQSLTAREKWVT